MLDDRVRARAERLEAEDAAEREQGSLASFAPGRSRGRRGSSSSPRRAPDGLRGARDRRLARLLDDLARRRRPLPRRARALAGGRPGEVRGLAAQHRRGGAGGDGPSSIEGDAFETLPTIDDVFDIVFIDAEKDDYERLFELARGPRSSPVALFVADNVLSHEETLGAYSQARQADPTLESVTVPLDRGLELQRPARRDCRYSTAYRGKEVVR